MLSSTPSKARGPIRLCTHDAPLPEPSTSSPASSPRCIDEAGFAGLPPTRVSEARSVRARLAQPGGFRSGGVDGRYSPRAVAFGADSPRVTGAVLPLQFNAAAMEGSSCAAEIPNLIGTDRKSALSDLRFRLVLRQQPEAARSCGFGERDRRGIDPPPIVELLIDGPRLSEEEKSKYLRYESYVMNCSIVDQSGARDACYIPEFRHHRRLVGSLVATPFVGQDERGREGCFFCFSDLSCRTLGCFRLKFSLAMIDPGRAGPAVKHFPIVGEAVSAAFHVYNAKDFPGMRPSSKLAVRLKQQGCMISIKKGAERRKGSKADVSMSEEEGEE